MTRQKRILLIDDNADHLLVCKLIFERHGYEVLILLGCEELIEAVEIFLPDLIFMDHTMPGICGPEAIQMLRSNPSSAAIPIIYFSAEIDLEMLARKAGANAWLKKPSEIGQMLKLANQFCS
jgi:CheY-like chemotaxis protein